MSHVGDRIRTIRELKGMTQMELSQRAKIHQSLISRAECGRASNYVLKKIASALRVNTNFDVPNRFESKLVETFPQALCEARIINHWPLNVVIVLNHLGESLPKRDRMTADDWFGLYVAVEEFMGIYDETSKEVDIESKTEVETKGGTEADVEIRPQ